jgi:hypothetical protein
MPWKYKEDRTEVNFCSDAVQCTQSEYLKYSSVRGASTHTDQVKLNDTCCSMRKFMGSKFECRIIDNVIISVGVFFCQCANI